MGIEIPYGDKYIELLKQGDTANRFLIDLEDGKTPYYIALNETGDGLVVVEP